MDPLLGKVAYPARSSSKAKLGENITLSPLTHEILFSQCRFSRSVPRQPAKYQHSG